MNRSNETKIKNLLSMAQRANKIVSGELAVEKFVQSGKANLLLIAADASAGTVKKYMDMAAFYQVDVIRLLSKQALGECIGKASRAAAAIEDKGFVKALLKLVDTNDRI